VSTVVYGAELRGCFMVFFMVTAVATALYK
jgi:hypothetical protein